MTATPRVEWVSVVGDRDAWGRVGLTVTDDGVIPLIGTSIQLASPGRGGVPDDATGIVGWAFSGIEPIGDIAGLATSVVDAAPPRFAAHPLGASGLDHLVVTTGDLETTSAALAEATGCELKRVREAGRVTQGFHRIGRGGLVIEIVQHEDDHGPAAFWGLVINVDDLDAACALIGEDRVSEPRDAVQPGRRIATIRAEAGLGIPIALMSS